VFAVADQRRFAPWLAASALAHVLGAVCLIALRPLPSPLPERLRVVRVDLVGPSMAPGPPAAAEAPVPARPAPVPPPARVAKPAPRKPPAPQPAPTVARAPAPAAPAAEPIEAGTPAVASGGGTGAGAGAALAAVAAGPPGAGGGGADALAAYVARLQQAIDAHKSYPPMARRRGIEGVVTVRLAIDATGGLERTALVGRAPEMLARSTREAVDRASPFPPPPGGPLQIEFPVRYEIVE
jgi:protein TonB